MLVSIPPHLGYLKGKSTLMIFDMVSEASGGRGYYVDTVGRNKRVIAEYIKNRLEEDYMADQVSIKEYIDPFTGAKNK